MVGKSTIRGIRITVEQILNSLAANVTVEELLSDYPELEPEYINAALMYAAKLIEEEKIAGDSDGGYIFNQVSCPLESRKSTGDSGGGNKKLKARKCPQWEHN